MPPAPSFTRFVALGDSQTEGIGDPDGNGGHRGWADRLADTLAAANPNLRYANLAVRGRRAGQIRAEQLAPALALQPDLVAVLAGMNDLIRPRFDQAAVLADIEAMLIALVNSGAQVITFTFPDIGAVAPIVRPLSSRVRAMNTQIRTLAARHDVTLIDFDPLPVATHPSAWAEDRLHLSPLGHALVASAVAETLALPGADPTWRQPPPPISRDFITALTHELIWARQYLVPWVGRRLRGESSGDGIASKRPALSPMGSQQ